MGINRPETFNDYIGQDHIKSELNVFIQSSQKRNKVLDHVLFHGPSGTGKTTLARIIANKVDSEITEVSGSRLTTQDNVDALIKDLKKGKVIFLDEIHRIQASIQERLYPVMEDYLYDFETESGWNMQRKVPECTFIGATTEIGQLEKPFKMRFVKQFRLKLYSVSEIAKIVSKTASSFGLDLTGRACKKVAKRSRQTPRIANNHCATIRDYALVKYGKRIDERKIEKIFDKANIRPYGLKRNEVAYLSVLNKMNKSIGLEAIANKINESKNTVKKDIEPYLLRKDLIIRHSSGRKITDKGIKVYREIKDVHRN